MPVSVVLVGVDLHLLGQGVGDDVVPDVHQLRAVHQPAGECQGAAAFLLIEGNKIFMEGSA